MRVAGLICAVMFMVQLAFPQVLTPRGGGYLGVRLIDLDTDRARTLKLSEAAGAEISGVEENCAAEKAGLRAGDVILLYNGESVLGAQQLGRLVLETPAGRKVSIRVWRDGKSKDFTLTTMPRPALYVTAMESGFVADIPAPLMVWRNMILGLDYEPLNAQLAQFFGVKQGSLVRSVEAGSPADRCGVKAGDVLTSVAGHTILTPRDLGPAIRLEQHGSKALPLDLTRDRKSMTVFINLTFDKATGDK